MAYHPLDLSDLSLTAHFIDNWADRVGGYPSLDMVRHIIQNSIIVQIGRQLRTPAGHHFSTLSIYWHPPLDIIITLDNYLHRAVSVLSASMNKPHSSFPRRREPIKKEASCHDLPN